MTTAHVPDNTPWTYDPKTRTVKNRHGTSVCMVSETHVGPALALTPYLYVYLTQTCDMLDDLCTFRGALRHMWRVILHRQAPTWMLVAHARVIVRNVEGKE